MSDAQALFEDIISKILLLDVTQIRDGFSRDDIEEWDSMSHLVLISDLEQAFNIILSDDEVADIKTILDVKKALFKHGIKII
jgi:acyl carrier protein